MKPRLTQAFFAQPTFQVARQLLGATIVRLSDGKRLAGMITETEAYIGQDDLGCHASRGRTARTQVMFGEAGHAYVYFTYGMHWLLNFVTEAEGFAAAVLLRAIVPTEGLDVIASRRGKSSPSHWADGPAKLCQAFAIDGSLNGADLCAQDAILFIEEGRYFSDSQVTASARIGLNSVPEPWKSIPWRFHVT